MGKNLVDEAMRLIKGDPPLCDNNVFRENESPRPVAVPDPTTLEDRLTAFYTAKLEAIAKIYYESGADFDWLKANHSAIYHTVNGAEDTLNKIWLRCLKGEATMQDFERALTAWYRANMQGIKVSVSKQADQKEQLALW